MLSKAWQNSTALKQTIALLVAWKSVILFFAFVATLFVPLKLAFTSVLSDHGRDLPYYVWIWGNFDALHYMGIAVQGYQELTQPFFPLFPGTMALLHLAGIPTLVAGLSIAHVCFLIALIGVYKLVQREWPGHWLLILSMILLFPTSMFYGAVYNDSIFFMLATWCIWAARSKKWVLAGLLGAIAMTARLNGLALFSYVIMEYWVSTASIEKSWDLQTVYSRLREILQRPQQIFTSGVLTALAIPATFLAYLGYIQYAFGDWHKLFGAMAIWKQANPTFPPVVFLRYAKILMTVTPVSLNFWVALVELLFILFYIGLAIWGWKKIRLSYWVYFVVSILIPWTTGTFQGMPRYGLHLFPFYLLLALWYSQAKEWQRLQYIVTCILLAFFIISCFTRGYFVT